MPVQLFESGKKGAVGSAGASPRKHPPHGRAQAQAVAQGLYAGAGAGAGVTEVWMKKRMEVLLESNRGMVMEEQRLKTRVHRVEEERDMLWAKLTEERNRLAEEQRKRKAAEGKARAAEREVARLTDKVAELDQQRSMALAARARVLAVTQIDDPDAPPQAPKLQGEQTGEAPGSGEEAAGEKGVDDEGKDKGKGKGEGKGEGEGEGEGEGVGKARTLSAVLEKRGLQDRLNLEMIKVQALAAKHSWPPLALRRQVGDVLSEQARFRAQVMAVHERHHRARFGQMDASDPEFVEAKRLFDEFDASMVRAIRATDRIDRAVSTFLKDYHALLAGVRGFVPAETEASSTPRQVHE